MLQNYDYPLAHSRAKDHNGQGGRDKEENLEKYPPAHERARIRRGKNRADPARWKLSGNVLRVQAQKQIHSSGAGLFDKGDEVH